MTLEITTTEKIIGILTLAFPNAKIVPQTVAIYVHNLADIEPSTLQVAAQKCLESCKFFPTIAELREAAATLTAPVLRSGIEAWGDVLAEVKRVGYNGDPQFADPAVTAVVNGFGWRNICLDEDVMVLRAHFIKAYEQVARREHDLARQTPEIQARLRGNFMGGPQTLGQVVDQLTYRGGGI